MPQITPNRPPDPLAHPANNVIRSRCRKTFGGLFAEIFISHIVGRSRRRRHRDSDQQRIGCLIIIVSGQGQTVIQNRNIEPDIFIEGCLPFQIRISQLSQRSGHSEIIKGIEIITERRNGCRRRKILIPRITDGSSQLQHGNSVKMVGNKFFMVQIPSQTDSPRTDIMLISPEYRRTVDTITEIEQITVIISIISNHIPAHRTCRTFVISRGTSVRITVGKRRKCEISYRKTDSRISLRFRL